MYFQADRTNVCFSTPVEGCSLEAQKHEANEANSAGNACSDLACLTLLEGHRDTAWEHVTLSPAAQPQVISASIWQLVLSIAELGSSSPRISQVALAPPLAAQACSHVRLTSREPLSLLDSISPELHFDLNLSVSFFNFMVFHMRCAKPKPGSFANDEYFAEHLIGLVPSSSKASRSCAMAESGLGILISRTSPVTMAAFLGCSLRATWDPESLVSHL